MSMIEIYKDSYGHHHFRLLGLGAQVLLYSVGFRDLRACQQGIELLRVNSPVDLNYERTWTYAGRSFNVRIDGTRLIASGELVASNVERENAIQQVKGLAGFADVRYRQEANGHEVPRSELLFGRD